MLSTDNHDKQVGPKSGSTKGQAWIGSKLFDTLMVFLKDFFSKKGIFEKESVDNKNLHCWTYWLDN